MRGDANRDRIALGHGLERHAQALDALFIFAQIGFHPLGFDGFAQNLCLADKHTDSTAVRVRVKIQGNARVAGGDGPWPPRSG